MEPPCHPPGLWTPAQTDRKGKSGQEDKLEAEVLPHSRTETGEPSPGDWPGVTAPGSCTRFPWGGILSPAPSPGSDNRLQETACHLTAQTGPSSTVIFCSGWNTPSTWVTPGPGSQGLPNPSRAGHQEGRSAASPPSREGLRKESSKDLGAAATGNFLDRGGVCAGPGQPEGPALSLEGLWQQGLSQAFGG